MCYWPLWVYNFTTNFEYKTWQQKYGGIWWWNMVVEYGGRIWWWNMVVEYGGGIWW
jgi:hypothetical protein